MSNLKGINNYPNCFYHEIDNQRFTYIFLVENSFNLPDEYKIVLNTEIINSDSKVSINNNKKGDKFISKLSFYLTKKDNEIVSIFIIPKVFNIDNLNNIPTIKERYNAYNTLAINIYKELDKFKNNQAKINNNNNLKYENISDFILEDYLNKLNKLQSQLHNINYSSQFTIISSDKLIGEPIPELHQQNGYNPLVIPQRVPQQTISDILVLTNFSLKYLKERITQFPDTSIKNHVLKKITYIIHKTKTNAFFSSAMKTFNEERSILNIKFQIYKQKEDIKNNPKIFRALKLIFFNELNENYIFLKTFNLTKIWEELMENELDLKKEETQVTNKFYGKWESKPDGVKDNVVYDFKYKLIDNDQNKDSVGKISGDDVTKLLRDIITIRHIKDNRNMEGELIYSKQINVEKDNLNVKLKVTKGKRVKIKDQNKIFDIDLYYSIYTMFIVSECN